MALEKLSPELQQTILGYLDFISLLNLRNASTAFRDFVNTSLHTPGVVLPARGKLLELYLEVHLYPCSDRLCSIDVKSAEKGFDGNEYLGELRARISHCATNTDLRIPSEFEHWVLEWPAHAPLGWSWFKYEHGDDGLTANNAHERLFTASAESDDVVGLNLESNGCQDYTVLFLEGVRGPFLGMDGLVCKGDICEMEDWDEYEYLAECWAAWLRMVLSRWRAWPPVPNPNP